MKKSLSFLVSLLLLFGCLGLAACNKTGGETYTVTVSNGEGVLCRSAAREGELVTVEILKDGYSLRALYVDGKRVEGDSFVMPAHDVSVTAALSSVSENAHTVSISETGECGRTVADYAEAEAGQTVTLTTYVAYGCSLGGYLLNGEPLEGNTFAMPAQDAVVTVLYDEMPETEVELTVLQSYQRATSRWYAGYAENGFTVEVVVEDNILFTDTAYLSSFAYADNVEFIFGRKTSETGWNGQYKVIVDATGRSEIRRYVGGWNIVNVGMTVSVVPCTLETVGFNGYRVNVFVPYSALGLSYASAPGNVSIAPAMRNTLNGLKSAWGSYSGMRCNWNDAKTHLLVGADGSFSPSDFPVKALFAGDGLMALSRWGSFYTDVGELGDVYSVAGTGRDIAYWREHLADLAALSPQKVYFSAGIGDKSPLGAFKEFLAFAEGFSASMSKTELVAVSPVPALTGADAGAAQAYAGMLGAYAEEKGIGFVDLCGAVCNGTPNRNLYASASSLSEIGYALLGKLIREEEGLTKQDGIVWGDSGAYVASDGWTENGSTLTLRADGTRMVYCREPFEGDFSVSLQLKAETVYNGDAFPKFGFMLWNNDRAHAFYISGEDGLTAQKAGYVPYTLGTFVWGSSAETAVPGLAYTGPNTATIRIERTGSTISFYVNETRVYAGDLGYGTGEAVVGLFSFNTSLTVTNWKIGEAGI